MADRAALKTLLESDAAFAAAVADGSCSTIMSLLGTHHATAKVAAVVPRAAIRRAIAGALDSLTADQAARLQIVLADETFDFTDAVAVSQLRGIIQDATARARIAALGQRVATVGEAAVIGEVVLDDVVEALKAIPSSPHGKEVVRPEVRQLEMERDVGGAVEVVIHVRNCGAVRVVALVGMKPEQADVVAAPLLDMRAGVSLRVASKVTARSGEWVGMGAIGYRGADGSGDGSLMQISVRQAD